MDRHSLVIALQDLSMSLQELAADPFAFVLHRTQCCSLAKSYALAVQHVTQQLRHMNSAALESGACQDLLPSLLELQRTMLQGRKLMLDCLYQDRWVTKAVVLALSTEVQDVCLHDLVWCLCVMQQAMGELVLHSDQVGSSVYGSLNDVWAESSEKEDLDALFDALQRDIACWEQRLSRDNLSTISRADLDAQCSLAKFLLRKLLKEPDLDNIQAPWDALPWAESHEFSIKEVIGHGAYAVVYEVHWHGEVYGQKEFFGVDRDVFAREAAIQARLRHPNLLQLICCTSKPSKNRYSLVMELMDMDMRSLINNRLQDGFNPPFSLLTSVDLMLQIAKGMEHLHTLHIMHRDLKSLNVLVSNMTSFVDETSSNCRMRVKIADFGMSKAKNQSSKFTTPHAGTTYWRAPEVFDVNPESEFQDKPNAKYTKKADVYSFAMVCYEILSGSTPFDDGGKRADLHKRLLKGERPKLPSCCPPYLVSYIERCWHGDPEQRPTFTQISRTLRHLKGILLTTADPHSTLALSNRSCARIEDKLEQMMGSQWPSTVSKFFSTRSMTISFEMSWFKVMECKLTNQKVAQIADTSALRTFSLSDNDNSDCNRRLKCKCSNLKHCLSMTLSCCGIGLCCCWTRIRLASMGSVPGESSSQPPSQSELPFQRRIGSQSPMKFSYSELARATDYFNEAGLLGVGGTGNVYKGILADGEVVAVKVLSARRSTVGSDFFNEIDLVSRVFHPNLVRLLGYCSDKDSLMLVYEFMARGQLGQNLYGQRQSRVLTWAQRYKIACGVASALDYLHHGISPRILHRDVKPSNILLDNDYNAHLTDFGIALLEVENRAPVFMGTPGYMAPEYFFTLELGPKVDVYGFGVVLLQLMSGRRFLEDDKITVIQYVWGLYKQGRLLDAVDERLRVDGHYDDEKEMSRVLLLGLMCCQSKANDRPTMHEVVQFLSEKGEAPVLAHDIEFL